MSLRSIPRAARTLTLFFMALALSVMISISNEQVASGAGRGVSDGTGWVQGPSLPPEFVPRWDFSMAYFPPTSSVVLFGGAPKDLVDGTWHKDTWIYQSGAWSRGPDGPNSMAVRGGASMAYDPDIGKIVLFGGQNSTWPPQSDTWFFDGTQWTKGPTGPPARAGARMAYDPQIHKIVLFGGSGVIPYTDTWLFDGTQWTKGPDAPGGMAPRQLYGLVYDPTIGKVVAAGGDTVSDVWEFDGSTWTPGPSLPSTEPKERFRLEFDPQLQADVYVSGLGPSQSDGQMWMLQNGVWEHINEYGADWPSDRMDAGLVWNPDENALMLVSGIADDFNQGQTGLSDSWFFRESPPQVSSVTVTPAAPDKDTPVNLAFGDTQGGYGPSTHDFRWLVNGSDVGVNNTRLMPGPYVHGDVIVAEVRSTDSLNVTGPWVDSAPLTVIDRPPSIKSASIKPVNPIPTKPVSAVPNKVKDKDGDTVTLHYAWTVNGKGAGEDSGTLTPDSFAPGDVIGLKISTVDSFGMTGRSAKAKPVTVEWNILAGSGAPGENVPGVSGQGFGQSETVDIHIDSQSGPLVGTNVTDDTGHFPGKYITLPTPLAGGSHMLYGVGENSGIVGIGPVMVIPTGSIIPMNLGAGDSTAFTGTGFVPGETVWVSFPGGDPQPQVADVTGSVALSLVSPPEPFDESTITASAPSGSIGVHFNVLPRLSMPTQAEPGQWVPVTLTGFGVKETVKASFDGKDPAQTFTTDASGSVNDNLLLALYYGNHSVTMTGASSGVVKTLDKLSLPAQLTLDPPSGPVGTVVTITSGPGWVPNETLHLSWAGKNVLNPSADATGAVSFTFTIPQHPTGGVQMILTDDDLGLNASTKFTVTSGGKRAERMI